MRDGISPGPNAWRARLLTATALAYQEHHRQRHGHQFYAASAQLRMLNWEALLFGSLDPANFITADKPPVSQW